MVLRREKHVAGEVDQRVVDRRDGFQIEVVGGLVEHEEVRAGEHHAGEHDAHLLAAGKHADGLVHVVAGEEHPAEEAAHVRFQLFGRILGEPLHHVEVAAVEILAVVLGEVVGGDGNAPLEAAAVGLDFLREDAEEGGLRLFVRADKGDFLPLGDDEGHVLEQLHAVLRVVEVRHLQDVLARLAFRREAHPRIAAGGSGHLLNGQLIEQLAAAGRLLRLGFIGREALNEGLQFLDFVLAALLLVVHQALHHLGGFIPEVVVADVELDLIEVDIDDMCADIVQEPAVMGHDNQRAGEIHQEILQPRDGAVVKVVRRFVQQQDVRIAEQRLRQQHLELLAALQVAHEHRVHLDGQPQTGQQRRGVGLGVPAVHLREFAFQLGSALAVRVRKIRLRVQLVLFLHDVVQALIAHDYRVQHRIGIVLELILLQGGQALPRGNRHRAGRGLQLAGQNAQERRFARAVRADNAIAVARHEFQIHT